MNWSRIVAPAAVLGVFALALPVSLPHGDSPVSDEDCLTLADQPPAAHEMAALERCAALYPDDVELIADLGRLREGDGQLAPAEDAYRRALILDPDYADIRLRLGRLLLQRGDAAAAAREAVQALRVQPNRRALIDLRRAAEARLTGAQE